MTAFAQIPLQLQRIEGWLLWKYVSQPGDKKPRKVPFYVTGGTRKGAQGSPNDRSKLATFDEAVARFKRGGFDGIGLAMLPDWGIVGLDFDNCITDGVIAPEVERLVAHTYAEISPSGKGVRAFILGEIPDMKTPTTEKSWGFEVFSAKGFLTITGNVLPICQKEVGANLQLLSVEIAELVRERQSERGRRNTKHLSLKEDSLDYFSPKVGLTVDQLRLSLMALDPGMGQDEGWLAAGMALHHETDGSDQGFDLWDEWSSNGFQYPGSELLRKRWDSFGKERNGRPVTARWLIKQEKLLATKDKPVLDPNDYMGMGRSFLSEFFSKGDAQILLHLRDVWYEWKGSYYQPKQAGIIEATLWKWLENTLKNGTDRQGNPTLVPFKPTRQKVDSVMRSLRAIAITDDLDAPCWLPGYDGPPSSELISMSNGLLHTPSRKLLPHSPGFFTLNALPYEWIEEGEPVEWLKFLSSIWADDQASIETLQEIFGYLVSNDRSQQKMFFLKGPKRSGKSTMGRVLTAMIGHANVVNPQLSSLTSNFGLQPLIDKLVAIFPDARIGNDGRGAVAVERLLMISGEDNITVDRKHLSAWSGTMSTRIVLFSNEIPKLRDTSGALAGRFIALSMQSTFFGREDHGLTDRLLKELPQILRWSLDGLDRLKARGYFIQPASARHVIDEFEETGSHIKTFVREECELGPNFKIEKRDLYGAYRHWCSMNGITHPMTHNQFGAEIFVAFPELRDTRPRMGNPGRVEFYGGIRHNKDYI